MRRRRRGEGGGLGNGVGCFGVNKPPPPLLVRWRLQVSCSHANVHLLLCIAVQHPSVCPGMLVTDAGVADRNQETLVLLSGGKKSCCGLFMPCFFFVFLLPQ